VTVLLLDGWEAISEQLGRVDHGRPVDTLLALVRDGEPVGVRAVVTGGRGVLVSRIGAVIGDRLLLRPNDPTDLLLAGVPPVAVPARQPPGRALRSGDGAQLQIAQPPALTHLTAEVAARWPTATQAPRAEGPLRLRRLPNRVEGPALGIVRLSPTWALVGQRERGSDAAGLDLADHRFVLVAGPPASGRSTTLVTMGGSLHAHGVPVMAICPAPSPLADGPWAVAHPEEVTEEHLQRAGVVLVDDLERVLGTPLERALERLVTDPGRTVVAAGCSASLSGAFRGLAALGRVHRSGVLLRPQEPTDGEVLGVRALLDDTTPPGRGLLVEHGHQAIVQVAIMPGPRSENRRRAVGAATYG
jgi:S-DNA-T family DNA segregation ATPase FtsK/SpoIIIE